MRSAGLADHLQTVHGMNLNGVVLVSPFLDAGSGVDGVGIDLPHALYLPTLAATAWYHDAASRTSRPRSRRSWPTSSASPTTEYLPALQQGYVIPPDEKRAVAAKLAAYTGTSAGLLAEGRPARQPPAVPAGTAARPAADRRPHRLALRRAVAQSARREDGLRPVLPGDRARLTRRLSSTTCTAN